MNIYFRELKAHKKAVIIWSICMVAFVVMGMQKYKAMAGTPGGAAELIKMLDSMPKIIQSMWGLSSLDISKPIGYFGLLFFYLVLIGGIHAGMLGASIISKEESDKTVEFLMTKPVARNKIVTSKLMAAITNVIIVNLSMLIPSIIILKSLTNDPVMSEVIICTVGMLLTQLLFLAVGISVASINKNPKKSSVITMNILLFSFFLSIIIDINKNFEILSFLTPFKYFDAKEILINGLNIGYILLTLIIIIISLVIAYKKYKKRDLSL